jgi:hypothetical protein
LGFLLWALIANFEIDHINHDRGDNRTSNLRLATRVQNTHNMKLSSRNKSGHIGVHYHTKDRRWISSIAGRILGRTLASRLAKYLGVAPVFLKVD